MNRIQRKRSKKLPCRVPELRGKHLACWCPPGRFLQSPNFWPVLAAAGWGLALTGWLGILLLLRQTNP